MEEIRRAERADISRIAEILVFAKRAAYRKIFRNDELAFGDLQVLPVAERYLAEPDRLKHVWVYGETFAKGFAAVEGEEITKLFVDPFFQGQGIGERLLDYAVRERGGKFLWALEENRAALRFYQKQGFILTGERAKAEDFDAYALKLVWNAGQEEN